MSSLLDAALAAAASSHVDVAPAGTGRTSIDAAVTLTGAHVSLDRRFVTKRADLSASLWADATWQGNRSAGISIKGTF